MDFNGACGDLDGKYVHEPKPWQAKKQPPPQNGLQWSMWRLDGKNVHEPKPWHQLAILILCEEQRPGGREELC
jgi:hypothetical protein